MTLIKKFLRLLLLAILVFEFNTPYAWGLESPNIAATTTFWDELSATSTTAVKDSQETPATSSLFTIPEPTIRVGLYKTASSVIFVSPYSYTVTSGREEMGVLPASELASLSYKSGLYIFNSASASFSSPLPIRLVPTDSSHYFTLENYRRPVKGRGKVNFNVYRGALEYRYSARSRSPYVINELSLEYYVAGIAESSNEVAPEYAKALLTAARTYAYVHIRSGPPTDNWLFDVYPTTQDQIYLGYNSELMMPNIVAAAKATAGEMVVFGGWPVITPYFGHSSGRTLSWKGTGKNARPWLKSVEAKYDKGKKQWGHGIGMSTRDASFRALKDGWTYHQILEYYYTGVEIKKMY